MVAMTNCSIISNGNRTEWSPIWFVIIRVITKWDDHAARVRFVYHEYVITDRIGRHEVLIITNYMFTIIKVTISKKRRIAERKGKFACE